MLSSVTVPSTVSVSVVPSGFTVTSKPSAVTLPVSEPPPERTPTDVPSATVADAPDATESAPPAKPGSLSSGGLPSVHEASFHLAIR